MKRLRGSWRGVPSTDPGPRPPPPPRQKHDQNDHDHDVCGSPVSAEGIKDLEALLWETPEETKAQKTMMEVKASTVKGEITEKRGVLGPHDLCGPESARKRKGGEIAEDELLALLE